MLSTMTLKSNGITYEIPYQKQAAPSPGIITKAPPTGGSSTDAPKADTGFTFIGEFTTIKEFNGNLTINGKEFGTVKAGDSVRVDKEGNVYVNGAVKTPK